jgi:integrase
MGRRAAGHVLHRHRRFFFRCRVPAALVPVLERRELVRSLRTADPRHAAALAAGLAFRLPALWRIVNEGRGRGSAQLAAAVDQWLREELDRQWHLFDRGSIAESALRPGTERERLMESRELVARDAAGQLERLAEDYRAGDFRDARPAARAIAARLDPPIREDTREFGALCKRVMEAMGEVEEARGRWAIGEVEYEPSSLACEAVPDPAPAMPPQPASEAAAPPAEVTVGSSSRCVRNAIEVHLDLWRRESKPTEKQLNQERSQLGVLVEVFGADRPVGTISRSEAGRVYEALRFLPKRWGIHPELKGLNFFDAAAKAKVVKVEPLNPRTINTYLQVFRGLFESEKRSGQITENPFQGMRVNVSNHEDGDEKGRAFNAQELGKLFGSPVFQGARSRARPFDPGEVLIADWRFWGAVIALMTGCRVGEIAQLRPEDIRQVDGIWLIDINRQGGRRLKTKTSARKIPAHNHLLDLGLVELAKRQRHAGSLTLLPECPKPVQDDAGKPLSRWMSEKVLPRLGINGRVGLGFHSLRHSMSTALRNQRVPDRTIDRLMGHQSRDVGAHYGEFEWDMLQKAVNSIALPNVVMHLRSR